MDTMYDDSDEYSQGLRALQDQIIMAETQGAVSYSSNAGGFGDESSMNMASEFAAWQMEQEAQNFENIEENSTGESVMKSENDPPMNGSPNDTEIKAEEDNSMKAAISEEETDSREASKRKLDEEDGSVAEAQSNGDGGDPFDTEDKEEGPSPPKKTNTEINVRKLLPELEKLWKGVEENPSDFSAWTYLLQYVDHENELLAAREAYDKFFERYPYCYGYWKKYADLEKRKGSAEDCLKVFKRGLAAIPLSVDLWIHYLNYIKATHESNPDFVRDQFQNAVETVGMEFRSDKLWELYMQYEKDAGDLKRLVGIYDQLLAIPTQSYIQHFEDFKELVNSNSPEDILNEDEYPALKELVQEAVNNAAEEEKETVEKSAIREKIIEKRSEIHNKTETEAKARWSFEEAIKRPYFHVKPLEKGQLKIWKEYLDFEIEKGDEKRIFILFERCLIACCLYEEYWIKYVKYLQSEKVPKVERLRDVLTRACTIHHPTKPWINLHWAAFEESQGNTTKAVEILENLRKHIPSSAHVTFRLINLHRRHGNVPACVTLFEEYIENRKETPEVVHIKIKFARFVAKFANDYDRAVKTLEEAFEAHESSRTKIAMALVDLGMERDPLDFELVVSSFDKALAQDIPVEEKVTFAHRKVEFLDDYGSDIARLQKAYEELQSLSSRVPQKKVEVTKPVQESVATNKYEKPAAGAYPLPPSQYGPAPPPTVGPTAAMAGQDYNGQYSQYPGWNYQAQPAGYGYPPQPSWNAYGGYQG